MKSRSVSITGATGFVGWHLAESFLADGWAVRAIVRRGNRRPVPAGVTAVEAALAAADLETAFRGSDVVIHSAALIRARDEATFNAVNVDGTRAAGIAAARSGARMILISSQAAGGPGTPESPRSESDSPSPVNAYGRSKLASERQLREIDGLLWTVLRPCAVYGARDRGFLPLFRMAARGLFLVPSSEDAAFTLIHIGDLTRAVRMAVDANGLVNETLFVGHETPHTGTDVLRAIAEAMGRPFHARRVPSALFTAAAKLGDLSWKLGVKPMVDSGRLVELRGRGFVCSVERARELLRFEAVTRLQDGITATARWYEENGWL